MGPGEEPRKRSANPSMTAVDTLPPWSASPLQEQEGLGECSPHQGNKLKLRWPSRDRHNRTLVWSVIAYKYPRDGEGLDPPRNATWRWPLRHSSWADAAWPVWTLGEDRHIRWLLSPGLGGLAFDSPLPISHARADSP